METTRLLVTGSNGLLGQKLVYAALARGLQLIATARGPNRLAVREGYVYEELDITNAVAVESLFERHRPQAVIHTAAMTNVDACTLEPETCSKVNVEAVRTIAGCCRKTGAHLVHLSTDFVFDGTAGPYRETDTPNPQSVYAQSKLDSEKIVLGAETGGCVIRTIIIYGVVDDQQRSNIVLWTKQSLEQKKKIRVITDQFRSPTLAEDLAGACLEAALRKAKGIYHVSGRELMSIIAIALKVAEYFKLDASWIEPVTSAELNQPAKRPAVTGFILDKAISMLGYRPRSFEEGLALVAAQLKEKKGGT